MSSEDKTDSGLAAEKQLDHRKSDGGDADGGIDLESTKKHIPYPKAIIFIVVCEFCERFNYYGMRTILSLYFKNILGWEENFATVIYHLFTMFCYFTPLLGAMLADSLLGKFRTIFYLSVVYTCGSVVLSVSATDSIPVVPFSMIGLALIAIGTGGIKPCVAAFGGDQFTIPGQEAQLASYFAVFYFAINAGSLISTTVTPIFREDVRCFDKDTCYPLAFSVPAILMIVALVIFLVGRPFYKINKPEGNVVLQVLGAIKHSFSRKKSERAAGRAREHWLDYADDKYDKVFLEDTKAVLKVLFLYLPLPLFWALFDQQGSRWTFQATRMNGDTFGYLIKPDQMQVVNPLLVLAFIPIFDRIIYPLLNKIGILRKPLQRLAMGGVFAGIAFAVSGFIELQLETTYALELEGGESSVHFVNYYGCPLTVTLDGNRQQILPNEMGLLEAIKAGEYQNTAFDVGSDCEYPSFQWDIEATEKKAFTYLIYRNQDNSVDVRKSSHEDQLEKSEEGQPLVRFMFHSTEVWETISFHLNGKGDYYFGISNSSYPDTEHNEEDEVDPAEFTLTFTMNDAESELLSVRFPTKFELELGGNYVITVVRDLSGSSDGEVTQGYMMHVHTITKPNSFHMMWLLPQYVIMTMGEIMFSITIMDFSYAEAPISMKSVMQSAWLMTVAFGNLIVVIIAEAQIFNKQWKEFFLFAGLMFLDMIIFAYMAHQYVPNKKAHPEPIEEEKNAEKEEQGEENAAYED